jgi:hypothetical protein
MASYTGSGFTFDYPKSWGIGGLDEKTKEFSIDPKKVLSSLELSQTGDVPPGLINLNTDEKNSYTIGYNDFPTVYIGKDKKIQAKKFEKYYSENAPEVSAQGKHTIAYLIGEDKTIEYDGNYNDAYLNDFNKIIDSLQI